MTGEQITRDETIELLKSWVQDRFDRLTLLAHSLESHLTLDDTGILELTEATRRKLKSVSAKYLSDNPTVDGCGLIFAHSALGTANGHLEWWVREDESRFARYSFGVVPGADRYYDYEQHEWFIRAFNEGKPALVGPYIDYLGVEVYVLTLTLPAEIDGIRVGAVGNDIQAVDLENDVLPILQRCPDELVLVNCHDTVLSSNSSRFLPGDYLPDASASFSRTQLLKGSTDVQVLSPLPVHS